MSIFVVLMALGGRSSVVDYARWLSWPIVFGSAWALAFGLYYMWKKLKSKDGDLVIEIDDQQTRIVRNGKVVYAGDSLPSKRIVEDGVAFHLHPPGSWQSFTIPKKSLTDEQADSLRVR